MTSKLKQALMSYMAGNMTCKAVTNVITDYLEGALPFWDWVRFHMHLGMCFGCRNYLRQMKQTIKTLEKLPSEPMPPAIRDELLKRFKDWKR